MGQLPGSARVGMKRRREGRWNAKREKGRVTTRGGTSRTKEREYEANGNGRMSKGQRVRGKRKERG